MNLQDTRKSLTELRTGLQSIRQELEEHHMNPDEPYGKLMWNFFGKAKEQLADLLDEFNQAESTFAEVIKYYGEDDKNMSSSEFYGIFKTFTTSYKACGNFLRIQAFYNILFLRNARPTMRRSRRNN